MKKINFLSGVALLFSSFLIGQSVADETVAVEPTTPNATAEATVAPQAVTVAPSATSVAPASCVTCGNTSSQCGCRKSLGQILTEDVCWSGYINAGYDSNFSGDRSNGYTDCWSNTSLALNAIYVSAVKKACTGGYGVDWGFGVDFMFGEDARLMQSAKGLDATWDTGSMYDPYNQKYNINSYGFAMPQLYVEAAMNNWAVKIGHFYGLLGYEGVKATDRFFYTKGIGFQITPITQSGVLVSYNGFQNLDITLGWVNGWNNGFDNSVYGESMVTGAFNYRINNTSSFKYAFQTGTAALESVVSCAGPYAKRFTGKGIGSMHYFGYTVNLTQQLEFVSTIHYNDYYASDTERGARTLVFGEHLYYTINSCWKVGGRVEWGKLAIAPDKNNETECTTLTFGANWHPSAIQNLTIRPELRYDRSVGYYQANALNGRPDQFTMGFDVMWTF